MSAMEPLKIGIVACAGRMGRMLVETVRGRADCRVTAGPRRFAAVHIVEQRLLSWFAFSHGGLGKLSRCGCRRQARLD